MKAKRTNSAQEPGPDDVAGVQRRNLADALFKATARCRFQRVKFLLDNGVSPHIVNDAGQNLLIAALYVADENKRDAMFHYLAKRGADCCFVDKNTGRDVTAWAAYLGRARQIETIFDTVVGEVDLHAKDNEGMTPLHHAVGTGHADVVQVLVQNMQKYHLSLDVPNNNGLSPYLYARKLGFSHIAEELIDGGCSTEQFDIYTFRNADQWAEIGRKERRRQLQKEQAMEKTGLVNKPRSSPKFYKLPAVKVTSDDNTEATVVFNIQKTDSFVFKKRQRMMRKAAGRHSVDALLSSASRMRLREDTALLLSVASSSTSSLSRHSVTDNISGIMNMVSQQCCHTYRKAVRPPTPDKVMKSNPFSSVFLLKAGRKLKGQLNKEQVSQTKQGGQNMNTVMSALSATKQMAGDYEKKKKRLLPPISG